MREVVRVVAPGGLFLAALGSYGGARSRIQARFAEITGVSTEPVGLAWDGWGELDEQMATMGGERLDDIIIVERDRDDLEAFVRSIEANRFSWTWAVTDDTARADAAVATRSWAAERWGPLHQVPRETFDWTFAVYRLT